MTIKRFLYLLNDELEVIRETIDLPKTNDLSVLRIQLSNLCKDLDRMRKEGEEKFFENYPYIQDDDEYSYEDAMDTIITEIKVIQRCIEKNLDYVSTLTPQVIHEEDSYSLL